MIAAHAAVRCSLLIAPLLLSACAAAPPVADARWISLPGGSGPGAGRHVVLVSGDEEYRSEEALPQLAAILSQRHGFRCTVLFALDPDSGQVDPDVRDNIPGLEALDDADLLVLSTRFRDLPDAQLEQLVRYVERGGPVIALRTSTHAFALGEHSSHRRWSWDSQVPGWEGGFGRVVLGETWIAHHGQHGVQGTRGLIAPGARPHPVLKGIEDGHVFGPTDVYRVRLPLPAECTPLLLGQVTTGLTDDSLAVQGAQNDPLMPVAWTVEFEAGSGKPERVVTTTLGASQDLLSAGVRRLLVNAAYWCQGLQVPETADVELVGRFEPSPFAFGGARKGLRPADFAAQPAR